MPSDFDKFKPTFQEIGVRGSLDAAGVPVTMHDSVVNYLCHGLMPGGFLSAVFANDLVAAYSRADHINKFHLDAYALFLYSTMPHGCRGEILWGSSIAVKRWVDRFDDRAAANG